MDDSSKKIFGEPGSGVLWMRYCIKTSAKRGSSSIRINKDRENSFQERKLGDSWLYPEEKLQVLISKFSEERL